MKIGDLVMIHSAHDGDVDGKLGVILDFVDEYLRTGGTRFAKLLMPEPPFLYFSPECLGVMNEAR